MSTISPAPSGRSGSSARPERPGGAWAMRDRPGVLWIIAAALTALFHTVVPDATWLLVHMLALGLLSHSIMVWSTHFATALLKSHPGTDARVTQNRRLVLLHLGVIAVIVGVPMTWWWLTLAGALAIGSAVIWHAVQLVRCLRGSLPGRFRTVIHHYLAAAAFLPVGAVLGVLLARGPAEPAYARLLLAHSLVNVLGWVGLTVIGTLVTLWPTILRTRMDEHAERRARQGLPALVAGLTAALAGSLLGWRWLLLTGVLGYLLALLWTGRSLIAPTRARPPRHFSAWSVAAGAAWFLIGITLVAVRVATAGDLTTAASGYDAVAIVLVVGFGVQTVYGALSHLLPSVLGGGPAVVRTGIEAFNRLGMTRIIVVNAGLAIALLPVPKGTRLAAAVLTLVGLAAFVPILLAGIRRCIAVRREIAERQSAGIAPDLAAGRAEAARVLNPPFPRVQAMAGVTLVALTLAAGPALGPALGDDSSSSAAVAPTAETTRVDVAANADMTFTPDRVEVPAGDRLVITVTNTDRATVHDLVFDDEIATPRLAEGESATLDLGVVSADREGWCSVTGHRRMGMTFDVDVTGAPAAESPGAEPDDTTGRSGEHVNVGEDPPFALEPGATWPEDFTADNAELPPLGEERTHRVTLEVDEVQQEVAPGVTRTRWRFGGSAPGPVLHGRVGDRFVITLVNDGSMGHSIDFHAGALAPDRPMRTIAPGERLTYTFTAERAGMWMYHCSTMPMTTHIANGMHGAVIIEPDGLPEVDRSYVLTASELYSGDPLDDEPTVFTFNGRAFQYDADPLEAKVGERVRFWVLAAGPNRATSFHVVGGQFDTLWHEGAYALGGPKAVGEDDAGAQTLGLLPAQGGFAEMTFPEAGHYPFLSHVMADAERGAHGIVRVR